jgi:hypothetical protein
MKKFTRKKEQVGKVINPAPVQNTALTEEKKRTIKIKKGK